MRRISMEKPTENTNPDLAKLIGGGTGAEFLEGIAMVFAILLEVGLALSAAGERFKKIAATIKPIDVPPKKDEPSRLPTNIIPDRAKCVDFLVAVKNNNL